MSYYTFVFKKNDMELQLTSTDKAEIEKQMKIWVNCVSVYEHSRKNNLENSVKKTEEIPIPAPIHEKNTVSEDKPQEKEEEKVTEPEIINNEPEPEYKTQESISQEEISENTAETETTKTGDELTINSMNIPKSGQSFTELLEQQIKSGTYEPKFRHDDKFINFINSVNIEDAEIRFGLLLKASYYLTRYENYDRVTLKDINAKLMQNFSIIVDHAIVEKAISQNLLEVVPDLTGMADAAEYRLTELGEKVFN